MGRLKRQFHRCIAYGVSKVLRPGAVYDPANFELWERSGYHITPVHFYSPVPSLAELRLLYRPCLGSEGIDMHLDNQVALTMDVFGSLAGKLDLADLATKSPAFTPDNDAFQGVDPYVYWCMIHWSKPKRIVEVGSGHSTVLAWHALRAAGLESTLWAIDPWPRSFLRDATKVDSEIRLVTDRVQQADPAIFGALAAGDILFVDSSHVARCASDVCHVVLQILPQLAPGVVVHFHDVFIPYDYPAEQVFDRHVFWNEQYLLQAYLADNARAEVLFASYYLGQERSELLKTAFPRARFWSGGSFWFRMLS